MTLRFANIFLAALICITVRGCIECTQNVQQLVFAQQGAQQ